MKIKLAKKFTNILCVNLALILISACEPAAERLHGEALAEIEKGHFRIALDLLEKSTDLEKNNKSKNKQLLEAARIARFEIQDYERAIKYYRKLILLADDENTRTSSQMEIAEIYLENLQRYTEALKEFRTLEPLIKNNEEQEKIKLRIIQALYLTGQNQQAIDEIDTFYKNIKKELNNFLKLKAQCLVALKKYSEAIVIYENLQKNDITYFEKENLFLVTSVVYEEDYRYEEALNYLNKFKKHIKDDAYLELRMRRLKERLINKPLFNGTRK